jgi:hypothetical protein
MKINAYILAADPAWIEASVLSYYDIVERIVVSYDADGRGWTGVPIDVEQCLRRLRAIDRDGKLDYRPGHFSRGEYFNTPMENDTHQRQVALDQAGEGADWVLQLDTDEVLGSAEAFVDALAHAKRLGRPALNYPSIYLYCHLSGRWFLEWCQRGWRRSAGYPGPLAVHPKIRPFFARRVEAGHYHVDLCKHGSESRVPNGIVVDQVISASHAVWHLSTVRSEGEIRRKYETWSHAKDRDWNPEVERWLFAQQCPLLTVILSQFARSSSVRKLKLARLPHMLVRLLNQSSEATLGGLRSQLS